MPKLTNVTKIVLVAILAALLIVVIIVYNDNSSGTIAGNTGDSNTSTGASLTAGSPTQTENSAPTTTTAGSSVGTKPLATMVLHFITPVAKDIWKIGTQDPISWDKPGGISGSISLIDATTNVSVGVVLPQVGPNQTSYTWNTRDLLLDRTDPSKKDVVPGTYVLKLIFDGNNIQPVTSPVFTITN